MNKMVLLMLIFSGIPGTGVFAARPFTIDDAGTVEKEGFEVEVASNYWKNSADAGIGLKHGLTDRMDIGAGFGYTALPEKEAQFSALEVGLKYAIVPDLLSTSVSASFDSPVYTINLILSKPVGVAAFHGNAGIEAESVSKSVNLVYGVAAAFNMGRITSGVEVGGINKELNWWQLGAQIDLLDWLAVDFGLGGDFQKEVGYAATTGFWFGF
ncbi:MAG: hypothetical protein GX089_14030 [Fibrobacter sp.]|jgi:hypothetical protein|nr:hypothetical protein [Fibrobacter sp.]HON11113.1 hypothetical protein [Chitinispirillaceae bacterium]